LIGMFFTFDCAFFGIVIFRIPFAYSVVIASTSAEAGKRNFRDTSECDSSPTIRRFPSAGGSVRFPEIFKMFCSTDTVRSSFVTPGTSAITSNVSFDSFTSTAGCDVRAFEPSKYFPNSPSLKISSRTGPVHFRGPGSRLVSCYALFKG